MQIKPLLTAAVIFALGLLAGYVASRPHRGQDHTEGINTWDGIDEDAVALENRATPAANAANPPVGHFVRWHMIIPIDAKEPYSDLNKLRTALDTQTHTREFFKAMDDCNDIDPNARSYLQALRAADSGMDDALPTGWTLRVCNDRQWEYHHYIELFYRSGPIDGISSDALQHYLDKPDPSDPIYDILNSAIKDNFIRQQLNLSDAPHGKAHSRVSRQRSTSNV